MSTRKRVRHNPYEKIWQRASTAIERPIHWLLRSLLVLIRRCRQQARFARSGFVLPTVVMVMLVVVLLTTAIMLRSFDRSKNASNVRVNQTVLNAAAPAIDRARAKLDALFSDPTLPRSTPSDLALYTALNSNRYDIGGETRLKLVFNLDNNSAIQKQPNSAKYVLEDDETLTTAWKFPVDTDHNGKFDSYTLYGIYFRSPHRATDGSFDKPRNPLVARTPPMSGNTVSGCKNVTGTSTSLIGDSSWYKSGTKLTKSFFVYIATVPITSITGLSTDNHETFTGNKGFSGLEFEQDRSQIPLTNNAALFQDDFELSPGATFRMNGRVFTNGNLLIGGHGGAVTLYQVSSKYSCFYKEENSKIMVGGNVGTGNVADASDQTAVTVHLFNGFGNTPGSGTINGNNRSTTSAGGSQVGYNNAAYRKRIDLMKQTALSYSTTNPPTIASVEAVTQYPLEVKNGFRSKINGSGGSSLNAQDVLADQIQLYLENRTRRVPYAEISAADGTGAKGTYDSDGNNVDTTVFASGTIIEPPAAWREPTNANTSLTLNTANLKQTQPEKQKKDGKETELGDRIQAGNNLPAYWKNTSGQYVTGSNDKQLLGSGINWTTPSAEPRYRTTQVTPLPDLGVSERNGFWEDAAAQQASTTSPNVGGLRVITGAGIYVDDSRSASFLPLPTLDSGVSNPAVFTTSSVTTGNSNIVVWPDTMPMTGGAGETHKGDLQMRATAIYHYKDSSYTDSDYINRTPTACVSSYYDPTNVTTAKNKINTDVGYGVDTTNGRSNNGIVYSAPYNTDSARVTGVTTYRTQLNKQARLVFPNGRIVNQPLRDALVKIDASGTRSLADNSAIDTAICAIRILGDTTFLPSTTPVLPHGAVKEASFLDAREVKAIEGSDAPSSNYDLALEQRQPSEIRVTDVDLRKLADTTIGSSTKQEYMLPNSGIIYAAREDALPDLSDSSTDLSTKKLLSPTDFILDPTRRPNGIRLINGSNLARVNTYREEEKGLILVTDLPVYVKADSNNGFNLHRKPGTTTTVEEFTNALDGDWGDFYTRGNPDDTSTGILDNNFACRSGQTGCATGTNAGDRWRPATIISDSISLQSNSYTDGFRNQGDYDLNNNAGSSVTTARLSNGFWNNSFATSASWWSTSNTNNAYPSEKSTDSYVGSYLTNGVTPIQQRVEFPEYLMEYCPKIPVSGCKKSDWIINTSSGKATGAIGVNFNIATHQAGTTARAASFTLERYVRRLAFKRKNNGQLELTSWAGGQATPIPLGINSSGQIAEFPYTSTTVPSLAHNALWFRTTSNTGGRPFCNGNNNPTSSGCTSDDRKYAKDKPLYYDGSTKLVSPPTPDIPGIPSLNLPASNPASGYTICTDQNSQGSTKKLLVTAPGGIDLDKCSSQPGNPMAQITAVRNALIDEANFNPDSSSTDNIVRPIRTNAAGTVVTGYFPPTTAGTTEIFTNNPPASPQPGYIVNVIDLGSNDFACTTIKLVGDENSIFVLRKISNSELSFNGGGSNCGVQVVLQGVEPNNVFWAIDANVKWNAVSSGSPHKMAGTFITDSTGSPKWESLVFEDGGRLLGPNNVPAPSNFTNTQIYAIASVGQPSLVPVLQVHSPGGSPGDNLDTGGSLDDWKQQATTNTTFNTAFISGNSPSRPDDRDTAGLHNFVRFMQRWSATVNIRGSFIQFKRSAYATGPFAHHRNDSGSLSIFGYNSSNPSGYPLPYYGAPTRQWGFDVGLLSQSPDLLSQKFTQQPTAPPDEFFREINRDDSWIQTLLCAAQGSGTSYSYAVDSSDRPSSCPSLSSYNDS